MKEKSMKICIISSQILEFEKLGGFGSMTRQLATSLAERGLEVTVAVLGRKGQCPVEKSNGFTILRLSKWAALNPLTYKKIDADVYHSQTPNLMSTAALFGERSKKHVMTCRDPRDLKDWWLEMRDGTWRRKIKNIPLLLFEEGPIIKWTIRKADRVAYAARWIEGKIKRMYGIKKNLIFLPNIEDVPKSVPKKAKNPTVCWVGRLDGRKRPELFIRLAEKFPHVTFLMVGKAEEETQQKKLEKMAKGHKNLKMFGFISKFDENKLYDIYNQSWIMVNTASREALPLTIIEATGRGCALLSYVDPDNFATDFGFAATTDNFVEGLTYLLKNSRWKKRGEKAHAYVSKTYGKKNATDVHISLYKELMGEDKVTIERFSDGDKKDKHKVSVIIPTIGRGTLTQTKEALLLQTRKPDEIIMVTDSSRRGVSWARNEGVRHTSGDLIVFLDDDCVPGTDWLTNFIDIIDKYDADGVGGTYKERNPLLHEIRIRRNLPEKEQIDNSGLVGTGGNVMYTRKALTKLKKRDGFIFDEKFPITQDWNLAFRLRSSGAKLIFTPNKILHLKEMSFFPFLRFQFHRGEGIAMIDEQQKMKNQEMSAHRSLLWEESGKSTWMNYLKSFWFVVVGPFDVRSFSKKKYFVEFWIGEKFKTIGFIYKLIMLHIFKQ